MTITLAQCSLVVLLFCGYSIITSVGLAIRPFTFTTNASCPEAQRNASFGCPCKLEGIPCRDNGTQCVNGKCGCGSDSSIINGTCEAIFNAVASIQSTVAVPCDIVQDGSIPGLFVNTTGATLPLFCNTGGSVANSVTIPVVSSQVDNVAPVTSGADFVDQPFVEIDPNGVAFIGMQMLPDVSMIPSTDPNANADTFATTLRQTYSGYCIDGRSITSNTFSFTVEFSRCP